MATGMSARSDLAALTESAERSLDREFARQVPRIGDAVRRHCPDGRVTWDRRRAILADVDAVLDALYGPRRGDPSPVGSIVEGHAVVAYGTPTLREAQRLAPVVRRHPDLAAVA